VVSRAGGYIALNFEIAGSGTVITSPQLGSSPRALRLENHRKLVGNYVAIGAANDAKGKSSDAR
jgi:hypothetical protein